MRRRKTGLIIAATLIAAGCGDSDDPATRDETAAPPTEAAATNPEPVDETDLSEPPEATTAVVEEGEVASIDTNDGASTESSIADLPVTEPVADAGSGHACAEDGQSIVVARHFDPDGVAVSNLDGEVLYEDQISQNVRPLPHPNYLFEVTDDQISVVGLSDGQTVATFAGNRVDLLDSCSFLVTGSDLITAVSSDLTSKWELFADVAGIVEHPDGAVAAVFAEGGEVSMVDFDSGQVLWTTFDPGDEFGGRGAGTVYDSGTIRDARTGDDLWFVGQTGDQFGAGGVTTDFDQVFDARTGEALATFDDDLNFALTPKYEADVIAQIDDSGNLFVTSADPAFSWIRPFEASARTLSAFAATGSTVVAKGNQTDKTAGFDSTGNLLWEREDLSYRNFQGAADDSVLVEGFDHSFLLRASTGEDLATFLTTSVTVSTSNADDLILVTDDVTDTLIRLSSGEVIWTRTAADSPFPEDG